MSGFYLMHRGWQESEFFGSDEYSQRDAWVWLIESAAWKETTVRVKGETIALERGQLCFAQRFMAEKWGWSKSRVDRFLKRLAQENMIIICSKNGATAGQGTGQGQSILTISNYSDYQDKRDGERGNEQNETGPTAGQHRGKEEQDKQINKEITCYAFSGRTIRLTEPDLQIWKTRYWAIGDVDAELGSLDDWISGQPSETRKKWFNTVSGALNKKHQTAAAAKAEAKLSGRQSHIPIGMPC